MKVNIKATGIELTPAIYDYVEKKLVAIDKYLTKGDGDMVVSVEVGKITQHHKSGEVFRAEVHITGAGYDEYASTEAEDLYSSIDLVKDEIVRELTSRKDKDLTLAKQGGRIVKSMMKGFSWGVKKLKFKRFRNPDAE